MAIQISKKMFMLSMVLLLMSANSMFAQPATLWTRTFGENGYDEGNSVQQTSDRGYIVAGYTNSFGAGERDFWLIRTDSSGDTLWTRTFGGNSHEVGRAVQQTFDGGYIGAGFTNSFGAGSYDLWLIRLDSDQIRLTVGTESSTSEDTIVVPVQVDFPGNSSFSSAGIDLSGYWGLLNFIDIDTSNSLIGSAGWLYQIKEDAGFLATAFAGAVEISGEGVLFRMRFSVPQQDTGFIPIMLSAASFDESTVPIAFISGGVQIHSAYFGDVSLDSTIHPYDASLILKYLVNSIELNNLQQKNADVSLDGSISALDASFILQYYVAIIDTLPYQGNPLLASGAIAMIDGVIDPGSGQAVEVPLFLSNGENILSFEGLITYNPQHLTFSEIVWSDELSNFVREVNSETGKIKVTGAASNANDSGDGVFATLRFTVNENFNAGETIVSCSKLRLNEEPVMENVASAKLSTATGVADNPSEIPK